MTESKAKFCGHTLSHSAHTVGYGTGNQCPGFVLGVGLLPRPTTHAQFMTAAEWVEYAHKVRGEPTYTELQAVNAELLAALDSLSNERGCFEGCYGVIDWRHDRECFAIRSIVAKAKGETP